MDRGDVKGHRDLAAQREHAGAIHNATGKRVRDLPITVENLLD